MALDKSAVVLTALTATLCVVATALAVWAVPALGQGSAAAGTLTGEAAGFALVGAALATGLSSLGAGVAVARVGAAAVGVIAEKPEMLGRTLLFVGLAEGIAIYGLIISVLILNRIA